MNAAAGPSRTKPTPRVGSISSRRGSRLPVGYQCVTVIVITPSNSKTTTTMMIVPNPDILITS